eukprot:scaffold9627_cov123-Isochrysis_galbana.AAC.2
MKPNEETQQRTAAQDKAEREAPSQRIAVSNFVCRHSLCLRGKRRETARKVVRITTTASDTVVIIVPDFPVVPPTMCTPSGKQRLIQSLCLRQATAGVLHQHAHAERRAPRNDRAHALKSTCKSPLRPPTVCALQLALVHRHQLSSFGPSSQRSHICDAG